MPEECSLLLVWPERFCHNRLRQEQTWRFLKSVTTRTLHCTLHTHITGKNLDGAFPQPRLNLRACLVFRWKDKIIEEGWAEVVRIWFHKLRHLKKQILIWNIFMWVFHIILERVVTNIGNPDLMSFRRTFLLLCLALCCDLTSLAEDEEIAAFYVLPNVLTVDTLP